ncbi:hypothetical protein [Candidatus Nitrospira allomarina]|uniref:Uncharacterized protein n=1 Tax=Candidatus Nitrospira allomarina TaxID=3020900 RepID=A0AA96GHT9_9BACT|nr:hypothetical protein [Candidatus Nitrospira allomarina]WNM58744.1 hypothetical protein PP769_02960 [Candidatus Nitrospira allomarina]
MAKQSAENYESVLKDLAHTMMSVARESVGLIKRSDQKLAMKLQRKQEWEIYLEFLRMLFNLVDRLSGFYIPIQGQKDFMNSLEDSVAHQLKTVLAPSLSSSEVDDMEVTLSVGQVVADSRKTYEKFKFVVTDQTKERDQYFQFFSERIASKAGAPGKQEITAAAFLCGSAVVPALKSLFEDATKPNVQPAAAASHSVAEGIGSSGAAEKGSSSTQSGGPETAGKNLIKLISVVSRAQGEEVESWWGLHPQFRRDLPPDEAKELAKHMNRATRIVGERFAVVASLAQAGTNPNQPVGNA